MGPPKRRVRDIAPNREKILPKFKSAEDFMQRVVRPYKTKTRRMSETLKEEHEGVEMAIRQLRKRRSQAEGEEFEAITRVINRFQTRLHKVKGTMEKRGRITRRIELYAFEKDMMERPLKNVSELYEARWHNFYVLMSDLDSANLDVTSLFTNRTLNSREKELARENRFIVKNFIEIGREVDVLERVLKKRGVDINKLRY